MYCAMPSGSHAIQFLGYDGFSFIIIISILSFCTLLNCEATVEIDFSPAAAASAAAAVTKEEGGVVCQLRSNVTGKK